MATWQNWSKLESATPHHLHTPASVAELTQIVSTAAARGQRVKMVGTGHSFTAISAPVSGPSGVMLRPDLMRGITKIDRAAGRVTAAAGTRLADLNTALASIGLSLHNMGDIAEQTLAGAVSTGTHGTGGRVAGLAGQVVAAEFVTAAGELVSVDDTDPELLDLVRVGLGALGVLVSVTFQVEPLFGLRATERSMPWGEFFSSYDELTAPTQNGASHLDAYWFPHTDQISTKRNIRVGLDELEPLAPWRAWLDDDLAQNHLFGALCRLTNQVPALTPTVNRAAASLMTARSYADVAHRVFVAKRGVVFKEMEYAVPAADGLAVLAECRRALERSDLRINFPVELRSAPAESAALSTASGRDSFYLAFHVHAGADHRAYFELIEPILVAAAGRPHWGKVHTLGASALAERYPRWGEFTALRDRLDPGRTFANPYLDRVLGE